MSRRSYYSPSSKYVVNLLPQFILDNWDFQRITMINPTYDRDNYRGENIIPDGNVMVTFPDGNYSEVYVCPQPKYYPYLNVGHTYYIRCLVRKENVSNASQQYISGDNSGVSFDIYWPEMEEALTRGFNSPNNHLWYRYSNIITLNQSQWQHEVVDGIYKIRFDCNNSRKYLKYLCFADFMIINLTKCYTQNGLPIPTLNELTAKPYFYGSIDLNSW